MNGGVIIPDKETAKALNDLARHKAIVRILNDIRMDMEICEIEGWDKNEYLNLLKQLLNSIGGDKTMGETDTISRQAAIKDAESWVAVDEYEKHLQKNVVEWLKEFPSAEHGTNLAEVGTDLISRQAAIDVVDSETVSTNPEHFKPSEKFINFMDDSDISSFGKWQWSNGFNTALAAVGIDLKKLPSAQPEIIRCKDCKHYHTDVWGQELGIEGLYGHIIVAHNACDRWSEHMNSVDPDGFCFLAERRTE